MANRAWQAWLGRNYIIKVLVYVAVVWGYCQEETYTTACFPVLFNCLPQSAAADCEVTGSRSKGCVSRLRPKVRRDWMMEKFLLGTAMRELAAADRIAARAMIGDIFMM